ncbi:zinc finger protein [Klosneuvirus KNV1]|uniref:Zinc finger protein n=1 Tax=Klosneuvirus KNV1 TaxID=1977640 RepID=A0A1V0SLH4_9VIRU|nr:zinc finger protein [Klosneuvirus KNV1]
MKYECILCNYSTDVKFSYERHLISAKHTKKKIEADKKIHIESKKNPKTDPKICEFCEKEYTTSSNLAKHRKKCKEKQSLIFKIENDKKEQENYYLKEMIKKIEEDKKKLEEDKYKLEEDKNKLEDDKKQLNGIIEHYQKTIDGAGLIIKTSVSALSYVVKNYKNAPVLEKLTDYSYITYKDDKDDADIIEMLYTYHETKTLYKYLGDIIIKAYKKEDPNNQSLWASDPSRLTYIVRELINSKSEWLVDKGGIKTTKYIIKPLMDYLDKYIVNYQDKLATYMVQNITIMSIAETEKISRIQDNYLHVLQEIRNNILQPAILKYIAPYFHVTKLDMLIDKDVNKDTLIINE